MQSGILHVDHKLGKKVAEKSGDFIMKKVAGKFNRTSISTSVRPQEESRDMTINRLISGSGIKRRRKMV